MKTIVILTITAVTYAGLVPHPNRRSFVPPAQAWHGSSDELNDELEYYNIGHQDFQDYPESGHVHGDYHNGHFEEKEEEEEAPKIVKHTDPAITVHVHEHHHHHHHHVKTLPISIIKKTVYIKHG